MIISHQHQFIFIKTKKTAGTSIEIALSKYCGAEDIITPIAEEDEQLRRNLAYRGPQNYQRDNNKDFFCHISAAEIKTMIPQQQWDSYYKFCFERNPWDKMLSWFYWEQYYQKKTGKPFFSNFDDFIHSPRAPLVGGPGGYKLYTIEDRVVVDRICLFENLAQEMTFLSQQLQLPEIPELVRAKSRFRKDKRSYTEIINYSQQLQIEKMFAKEIKLCNYHFAQR